MSTPETTCDVCGCAEHPITHEYACLPHVLYPAVCARCAEDLRSELARDGETVPDDDPHWCFRQVEL